jgi:hypothetical protein
VFLLLPLLPPRPPSLQLALSSPLLLPSFFPNSSRCSRIASPRASPKANNTLSIR